MPAYGASGVGGTWLGGGFDPDSDATLVGNSADYATPPNVAVPYPIRRFSSVLSDFASLAASATAQKALRFSIVCDKTSPLSPVSGDVGRCISFSSVGQTGEPAISPHDIPSSFRGSFEIISVADDSGSNDRTIVVRKTPSSDPMTGKTILDNGPYVLSPTGDSVSLSCVLHPSVEELFSGAFNPMWTDLSRLQRLLSPRESPYGLHRGFPTSPTTQSGKAIFSLSGDPGNLASLGFEMVLFPAVESGGESVPDFSKPIYPGPCKLDPTGSYPQELVVDYEAGLVLLSHEPVPGTGCQVAPNGILELADNPRREPILFCACVPRSSQRGGVRIQARDPLTDGVFDESHDSMGKRILLVGGAPTSTMTDGSAFSFASADPSVVISHDDIPETGYFVVVARGDTAPPFSEKVGPFSWRGRSTGGSVKFDKVWTPTTEGGSFAFDNALHRIVIVRSVENVQRLQDDSRRGMFRRFRNVTLEGLAFTSSGLSVSSPQVSRRFPPDSDDVVVLPIDESTGTTLTNLGTSGGTLSCVGNMELGALGVFDLAAWLPQGATRSGAKGIPSVEPTTLSVSCWVNPAVGVQRQGSLGKIFWKQYDSAAWSTPSVSVGLEMVDDEGTWQAKITAAGVTHTVSISRRGVLPAGRWSHIGLTYDESTGEAILYANGERVGVDSWLPDPVDYGSSGPWVLGAIPSEAGTGSFESFVGTVDEARVSLVVRPASWWKQVYRQGRI